jgi:hypothetical protein
MKPLLALQPVDAEQLRQIQGNGAAVDATAALAPAMTSPAFTEGGER